MLKYPALSATLAIRGNIWIGRFGFEKQRRLRGLSRETDHVVLGATQAGLILLNAKLIVVIFVFVGHLEKMPQDNLGLGRINGLRQDHVVVGLFFDLLQESTGGCILMRQLGADVFDRFYNAFFIGIQKADIKCDNLSAARLRACQPVPLFWTAAKSISPPCRYFFHRSRPK